MHFNCVNNSFCVARETKGRSFFCIKCRSYLYFLLFSYVHWGKTPHGLIVSRQWAIRFLLMTISYDN